MMNRRAFSRYVWGLLAYNLIVILWGAYVRASFSGDGCGAHWPLCGEYLIPDHPHTKTIIELAARRPCPDTLVEFRRRQNTVEGAGDGWLGIGSRSRRDAADGRDRNPRGARRYALSFNEHSCRDATGFSPHGQLPAAPAPLAPD